MATTNTPTSGTGNIIESPPTFTEVEKAVATLTPIFAIAAGWVATVVARYFPGVQIPRGQLIWAFVVGVASVVFVVLKWLHSRDKRIAALVGSGQTAVLGAATYLGVGPEVAAIEGYLKNHVADVERLIEEHVPAVVRESMDNLLNALHLQRTSGPQPTTGAPPAPPPAPAPAPAADAPQQP